MDPTAFLLHHRHAPAAFIFFVDRFGLARPVPEGGVFLHVHARVPSLCDEAQISPEAADAPHTVVVDVWNHTGSGLSGYHYDPIFCLPMDVD